MSSRIRILYIAATLLGAIIVLLYQGPGWPFVRGHMGDWLVVQFMYLVARFWISERWRFHLGIGVLLTGLVVEIVKFFASGSIPHTFLAEITLGSVFDPLDLIAFAIGVITVLVIEQVCIRNDSTPKGIFLCP